MRKTYQKEREASPSQNTINGPNWVPKVAVKFDGKGRKLFIGGLSLNTTSELVSQHFSMFGAIQSIRLVGEQKNRPRGYGFVIFFKKQSLRAALAHKDHIIEGRQIDCSIALDSEKGHLMDEWPQEKKIHVSNLPVDTTKCDIDCHFRQFGEVQKILLFTQRDKKSCFAFVIFLSEFSKAAALKAPIQHFLGTYLQVLCRDAIPKGTKRSEIHQNRTKNEILKIERKKTSDQEVGQELKNFPNKNSRNYQYLQDHSPSENKGIKNASNLRYSFFEKKIEDKKRAQSSKQNDVSLRLQLVKKATKQRDMDIQFLQNTPDYLNYMLNQQLPKLSKKNATESIKLFGSSHQQHSKCKSGDLFF